MIDRCALSIDLISTDFFPNHLECHRDEIENGRKSFMLQKVLNMMCMAVMHVPRFDALNLVLMSLTVWTKLMTVIFIFSRRLHVLKGVFDALK